MLLTHPGASSESCRRTPGSGELPGSCLGSVGIMTNIRCFHETRSNSRGWESGAAPGTHCRHRRRGPAQEGSSSGEWWPGLEPPPVPEGPQGGGPELGHWASESDQPLLTPGARGFPFLSLSLLICEVGILTGCLQSVQPGAWAETDLPCLLG